MFVPNTRRALLLWFVVGALRVNAFPADGAENSLLPTFTLIGGNGGSETGRCTGADLDNLKASYEDMCLMARSALTEFDFLLAQAGRTEGDGPPKPENKQAPQAVVDNWKRWKRVRATYLSMFGKDPFTIRNDQRPEKLQPGQPAAGHKPFVRSFYNSVVLDFCGGQKANRALLVCTDAHYQFIKIGTPDPGDAEGRNIEATQPQCRRVGGVWYSAHMPPGRKYETRSPPENPGDGPICVDSGHSLAVTDPDGGIVMFCKDGLDTNIHSTITLQDLRGSIKPTNIRYGKKVGDREAILKMLGAGTVTKLEDIKGNGGEIMPLTWLHELHHLIRDSKDELAVDKKGNPISTTGRRYNEQTGKYEDFEDEQKTYGYDLARNLALHTDTDALTSPENAAFFALATFFSEQDWSRGFAMPFKEP